MNTLRTSTKLYLAAVAIVSAGVVAACVTQTAAPSVREITLATLFTGLVALAVRFPLQLAYRTKLTLDTVLLFTTVLLLEPGVAVMVALVGSAISDVWQRRPWSENVFNTSQTVLYTGLSALLLTAVGWNYDQLLYNTPFQMIAVIGIGAISYVVSTGTVSVVIGLESGYSPTSIWRQIARYEGAELLAEFALGVLAALLADASLWSLPLVTLPVLAVYRSMDHQIKLRKQTIEAVAALADIVDVRDPYTANHSRRVAEYSRAMAIELRMTPDEVGVIEMAARVHDLGKMILDISILTKQSQLNAADWACLKQHPITGADILSRFPQFAIATSYVRHHHERLDGRGYPDGLRGAEIPLGARIITVADTLDAMSAERPYRPANSMDVVLAELERCRNTQFDPVVVDALLRVMERDRIALPGSEYSGATSPAYLSY